MASPGSRPCSTTCGATSGISPKPSSPHGKIKVMAMDSLFLAWLDCRALGMEPEALHHFLLTQGRVWLDPGPEIRPRRARLHARRTRGCPRKRVDEALAASEAVL